MGPRKYRKAYVMPNTFAALWWNLLWLLARKGLNGPMRPVMMRLELLARKRLVGMFSTEPTTFFLLFSKSVHSSIPRISSGNSGKGKEAERRAGASKAFAFQPRAHKRS